MVKADSLKSSTLHHPVRLLGYYPGKTSLSGGIPNYIQQLASHLHTLDSCIQLTGGTTRYYFSVQPYSGNEILHIPQIMGSQVLLRKHYSRSVVTVLDLGGLLCPLDKASSSQLHKTIFRAALMGLKKARYILAISNYTKTTLVNHLGIPADRIVVTWLGVDRQLFNPVPQKEARQLLSEKSGLKLPEEQPVILYVGSELPRKNLNLLWQSLRLIRLHYPRAVVLKVGKPGGLLGQRDTTLSQIAAQGQTGSVLFLDDVDNATLPLLYSAADLLVQPSLYEGFSLPVAEAMACECPVLAANATCLPEIVGKAGILFDPTSPGELAEQTIKLFESRQAKEQLIEAGLERVSRFDWLTTARQTLEVYQKL